MIKSCFGQKNLGMGGAFIISAWLTHKDNGALVKLDASDNDMFGRGDKSAIQAWADALKTNSSLLELNLAKNDMRADDAKIFADGVSTNGAMTSLSLSANRLGAAGAMIVAEAIKVTTCTPAIILVPFSCLSDFSINCCCLLLSPG